MAAQLDIFEERYLEYYKKFYSKNLREAQERKDKPTIDTSISILTGEVVSVKQLIDNNRLKRKESEETKAN